MPSISICGQDGSYADELAAILSRQLGLPVWNAEALLRHAFPNELSEGQRRMFLRSPKFYRTEGPDGQTYLDHLRAYLMALPADRGRILLNCGGAQLLRADELSLNLYLSAPLDCRIERLAAEQALRRDEAEARIRRSDRRYQRFMNALFGPGQGDDSCYDLCISTARLSLNIVWGIARSCYDDSLIRLQLKPPNEAAPVEYKMQTAPVMKNPSELDFARLLDRYGIDWRYEPRRFPIEWDSEGRVSLAFSPDFYLPRFDLYLELTTMEQSYITRKNKKAKKVEELYPGVHVRIVNRNDFIQLMERFREP